MSFIPPRLCHALNFHQIPDFIVFEDRLDNSLARDAVKVEHVRMRIAHEQINPDLIDLELVELKFIFNRCALDVSTPRQNATDIGMQSITTTEISTSFLTSNRNACHPSANRVFSSRSQQGYDFRPLLALSVYVFLSARLVVCVFEDLHQRTAAGQ